MWCDVAVFFIEGGVGFLVPPRPSNDNPEEGGIRKREKRRKRRTGVKEEEKKPIKQKMEKTRSK